MALSQKYLRVSLKNRILQCQNVQNMRQIRKSMVIAIMDDAQCIVLSHHRTESRHSINLQFYLILISELLWYTDSLFSAA